ncbi:MAG TPA: PEP-CTERM sorting domain-containing protein [Phycisphaerae bacterium]|nr:PEP-CTERM sorting domain-containing protein [Phycisphaerales bacterium]HNO76940.1 PEP-CTERM sorting domain-containing protein [Phycisphaerae bacterium]
MRSTLLSLTVLMFTTAAMAGVTETNTERFTYTLIGLDNTSAGPTQNDGPSIYGNFTDAQIVHKDDGPDSADANASQNSNVAPASYDADLDTFAFLDYSGFFGASTDATTEFNVAFTLDSSMDFSIDGLAETTGSGSGVFISIANVGAGGTPSQSIVNISLGNNNVTIDADGTLLPGDYELRARATAGFAFGPTGTTTAATNFTMTLTPEPASLALLAMGGLTILRRRRTN